MIGVLCVKKLFRVLLPGVLLCLNACWSLGAQDLPEQKNPWRFEACSAESEVLQTGLEWRLNYLGPSKALSTAKTAWNSHLRYVYPFTRHTQLFELTLNNTSRKTLWVEPEQVVLQFSEGLQKPLGLTFFEQAWPSGAVRSENELLDRSLAISEIYARLLTARPVLPGESVSGVLAFRSFDQAPREFRLENWRWGSTTINKNFCLNFLPQ